jgi:signal transduction histidine kinase
MILRHSGDQAELRITNTSDSIESTTLENVFDRFVRGENARGKVEGCGLGLSIAQWIVHAHGGTIRLIADQPGKITALVRLPAKV